MSCAMAVHCTYITNMTVPRLTTYFAFLCNLARSLSDSCSYWSLSGNSNNFCISAIWALTYNIIFTLITPYIRMLDSDWLIAVIFFTNSGLASWICRIFTSCRCICIRFNFFSWYLQNRISHFYPSPRRL
jgi:hypothetical protein